VVHILSKPERRSAISGRADIFFRHHVQAESGALAVSYLIIRGGSSAGGKAGKEWS